MLVYWIVRSLGFSLCGKSRYGTWDFSHGSRLCNKFGHHKSFILLSSYYIRLSVPFTPPRVICCHNETLLFVCNHLIREWLRIREYHIYMYSVCLYSCCTIIVTVIDRQNRLLFILLLLIYIITCSCPPMYKVGITHNWIFTLLNGSAGLDSDPWKYYTDIYWILLQPHDLLLYSQCAFIWLALLLVPSVPPHQYHPPICLLLL